MCVRHFNPSGILYGMTVCRYYTSEHHIKDSIYNMEKHVYSILAIKKNTRKKRKNAKTPPKPTIKMNTTQIERQDQP